MWTLQESARRQATVLAVAVLDADADADADEATRTATLTLLDAQLRHAIGQTCVRGRVRTALLDLEIYEALNGHLYAGSTAGPACR